MNILDKDFDTITIFNIQELIDNSVSESKELEYKASIEIGNDKEKKEFLADVSSFANASGGILIYGLSEQNGIAKSISGIPINNDCDGLLRKIDSILRDGLSPRITYKLKQISFDDKNDKIILVFKIEKSWNNAPHRVVFGGHDKFYSRNSAGKYSLDVTELRDIFVLSNSLEEKITAFRDRQIMSIVNGDTPVHISNAGQVVLHFIPYASFYSGTRPDMNLLVQKEQDLGFIYPRGYNTKYNLNGHLVYSPIGNGSNVYTQIFRNGIIESLDDAYFRQNDGISKTVAIYELERDVLVYFSHIVEYYKSVNITTPVCLFMTLINVKGYRLNFNHNNLFGIPDCIEHKIINLPEIIIDGFNVDSETYLRPLFDMIWNACSFEKSNNFDDSGKFKFKPNDYWANKIVHSTESLTETKKNGI